MIKQALHLAGFLLFVAGTWAQQAELLGFVKDPVDRTARPPQSFEGHTPVL
jgi:hypothetical protein